MIFVTDASGKTTHVGPEWEAATGQPTSEAVEFGWITALHPDDRAIVRRLVLDAARQQSDFTIRCRMLLRSGEWAWVAAGAVPSYGPPGQTFLGYLGSFTRIAGTTEDGVKTSGTLGRTHPSVPPLGCKPTSLLEMAADHLILAHSLLKQDGGRSVLPALETTLHQVGVALARALQDEQGPNALH